MLVTEFDVDDGMQCSNHEAQGGAPGSEALKRSEDLKNLLQKQQSSNRAYAAMCAAPAIVLEAHGLLKGKKATAHPGFVDKLSDSR